MDKGLPDRPLILDRLSASGFPEGLSVDIQDFPDGIVIPLDKPWRWTSADAVRKVKYAAIRHFGKKNLKVGHAGTLDPLATGVLIICIGPATRIAQTLQDHPKEYVAGISFGATTPSYDLEKEPDRTFPVDGVSRESLNEALKGFIGEQEQIAPLFSAKSVDGVRAYEMARKMYRHGDGSFDEKALEMLQMAKITISEAELMSFCGGGPVPVQQAPDDASSASGRIHYADVSGLDLPHAEVRIRCSKGTYIRAFARDLGEALGSGAFLHSLRRTCSGPFKAEDALTLEDALSLL